jgi:hypothetical protein
MIIRSATVKLHQWERERNTLTTSREEPARKRAGEPIVVSEESETFCISSVSTKVAHLFLAAYPPSCLSCSTNFAHISRTLPSIMKSAHEGTLYSVGPPGSSSNADAEEQDGVCHNWGVGRGEFCNTLESSIQT